MLGNMIPQCYDSFWHPKTLSKSIPDFKLHQHAFRQPLGRVLVQTSPPPSFKSNQLQGGSKFQDAFGKRGTVNSTMQVELQGELARGARAVHPCQRVEGNAPKTSTDLPLGFLRVLRGNPREVAISKSRSNPTVQPSKRRNRGMKMH